MVLTVKHAVRAGRTSLQQRGQTGALSPYHKWFLDFVDSGFRPVLARSMFGCGEGEVQGISAGGHRTRSTLLVGEEVDSLHVTLV